MRLLIGVILSLALPAQAQEQFHVCRTKDGRAYLAAGTCAAGDKGRATDVTVRSATPLAPGEMSYAERRLNIQRALVARDYEAARSYAKESWERDNIEAEERRWQEHQIAAATAKAKADARSNRPATTNCMPNYAGGFTCR